MAVICRTEIKGVIEQAGILVLLSDLKLCSELKSLSCHDVII